jgi:hypothetical protein
VETSGDVIALSWTGRAWRSLLLLALAALFLAGTAVGQDDWWPFGPWRMFAASTSPSGSVHSLRIEVQEGTDPAWRPADLEPSSVGLNRAEVEGRVPALTADPELLGTLAVAHSRLRPEQPAWRAIRVVDRQILLSDGTPTGEVRDTVLADWTTS